MKIKKLVSIILIISLLFMCINSFAGTDELKITVSKSEVAVNEEFYIVIDTTNVELDEFEVSIFNNFKLNATSVEDDGKTEVSVETENSDTVKFKVDKIESTSNKFAVYYIAPSQETNIEFTVELNGVKEVITEETVENVVIENITYENVSITEKITVLVKKSTLNSVSNNTVANMTGNVGDMGNNIPMENVIGNNDKNQMDKEFSEEELDGMFGGTKKEMQEEMMNMKEKMLAMQEENTSLQNQIKSASVTYQGSYNNYLESLSITGVEFKNTFHKTISTYFAEVDSTVEDVTVKAVAEDSSAIVTIVGNKDLQTGKNKILINVTADDNSIRTYRIYVTKN